MMGLQERGCRRILGAARDLARNSILLMAALALQLDPVLADAPKKWTPEQIGWQSFPLKPDRMLEYKTVTGKDGALIGNSFISSSFSPWQVQPVPEPETWATAALLLIGGGIYLLRRKNKTA